MDVATRQRRANAHAAQRQQRSSMRGLTLRTALEDIREVLVDLPRDYFAGGSLVDLLVKNDRLRGLGLLALALGLFGYMGI